MVLFFEDNLVADDTASNRELLSEALRNAGLTVLCAVDGSEAVEMAKQHLPDIIFMDIRMPEKDGVCAARELKCIDSTAAIPIVAVTASVSFSEEEKLKGLFDGFLNKPISLARLFAEAARFLRHEVEEQETEKSENLLLPPEAFEQMNEPWQLCEIAEKDFLPVIAELEGAIVIGKVKALAERLKQVSSHHSFNHLLLEADRLMSKAGAFDISGMREICLRIRKILQQVISFYSRG
jgi:CheY-like chemotaxis protein